MKLILATLFAIGILVTSCNASCYNMMLEAPLEGEEPPKGCDYKGTLYAFHTRFRTEDCFDCSCMVDHMKCCTAYGRPVKYDSKKCIAVFDKEACSYSVVQKKDRSKFCDHAMVG
ncbi:beta-microseminoprotein-like [Spea bombifrons]|uniref:beta-microseminoprotein-like n=1 Tax=Spea bombifrons TaxID=233779 RepID=UPI0023492BCE|nr:beta-microseminoprotein-like [Spea bombifrons]